MYSGTRGLHRVARLGRWGHYLDCKLLYSHDAIGLLATAYLL